MKKIISIITISALTVAVFSSCKKDHDHQQDFVTTLDPAYIKVVHIAPNFRQVFNTADSFNVYLNDNKLSGPLLTFNGGFPALTSNINTYAEVRQGTYRVSLKSSVNGNTILFLPRTLLEREKYSFLITDSVDRDNAYSSIWLKDEFTIPDTSKISLRFVHAVMNDTVGKAVDVYSKRYNANIFSGIAKKGATAFVEFPYTTQSDTLTVRRAGTLNALAVFNTASFSRKRVYTIVYKGSTTATSTKGKNILIYNNY
ncbi:DUF4397 domain-containing protein [Ferruginibacter sp. HRS2-29]|uniref:DUF4397 domain-containing protein n=1 Tax=Ferruginibacter sp. HRS2-29 TaxID=2487334 RepID=UPI0020CF72BC|nr:DUF4397 domain-containing protein [Ferruginibacter sp. HRS2-29]MCP9751416.1 DUF4397 domain-containing protein [Ferruginibacter sp. HRS2-29]